MLQIAHDPAPPRRNDGLIRVARVLLPFLAKMPVPIHTTMLELVTYLTAVAKSDGEVVARVTELVNGGVVVLRGNFAGRKIV